MDGLARRYLEVRRQTERLAEPLSAEDCQAQSMPDASPTKWHLAHTSWFFQAFVLPGPALEPSYEFLFNSYYEAVGPRHPRPARGLLTRPSLDEVRRYRQRVDERVLDLCERGVGDDARARIVLGLHHEQQHQELILTDIKHLLGSHPHWPAYRRTPAPPARAGSAPPLEWIAHGGGVVTIGVAPPAANGEPFAFDNESPAHQVLLRPYALASRLVTCGEYRAFMRDGGYRRPELWLSDGWAEIVGGERDRPLYWREETLFTLDGERPLRDDEPVAHVSYYEADAFARWADARLPTEAEWRPRPATTWRTATRFIRAPSNPAPGRRASSTATSGSGRPALTCRTPASAPRRARSANTTASSCRTRWSSAVDRARRRAATSGRATETSFRPGRAGSSAASAWRVTRDRDAGSA
jgi:ergothioneine biosynthesis protein EgtB